MIAINMHLLIIIITIVGTRFAAQAQAQDVWDLGLVSPVQ